MDQRLNTGLLVIVTVLTAINTIMIGTGSSANSGTNDDAEAKEEKASNVTATKRDRSKDQGKQGDPEKKPKKEVPRKPPTKIEFEKSNHDFGKVKPGTKVSKDFKFKNVGDNPYVIQNAKGSCGCTVPQYPKKPIQPGESANITVNYSPSKRMKGEQNNSVTLTGNTEPRKTKLRIKANVAKTS